MCVGLYTCMCCLCASFTTLHNIVNIITRRLTSLSVLLLLRRRRRQRRLLFCYCCYCCCCCYMLCPCMCVYVSVCPNTGVRRHGSTAHQLQRARRLKRRSLLSASGYGVPAKKTNDNYWHSDTIRPHKQRSHRHTHSHTHTRPHSHTHTHTIISTLVVSIWRIHIWLQRFAKSASSK